MSRLVGGFLAGVLLLLGPGCVVYEYSFRTVVSPAGEVSREIAFEAKETKKKTAEGEGAVEEKSEHPDFPKELVLPDRERFDRYELERGRLAGSWHSGGVIRTDFRYALPGADGATSPTAYNEGEVFVREYGLVRSINCVETFHDFRERWEWERNADTLIEEAATLALNVIEDDFGSECDLGPLKDYVHEALVPFLKNYKTPLFQYYFTGQQPWRSDGLSDNPPAPWELGMAHELMKLGLAEDLQRLDDFAARPAVVKKIQELLAGPADARAELRDRLQEYFAESGQFEANLRKKVVERYGNMESFADHVTGYCYSFSLDSDMISPKHGFTVFVSVPGAVSYVSPEPESREDKEGRTEIEWEFTEWAFFPDGVRLIAISFVPVEDKQKEILGAVVLDEAGKMADYATLFRRLDSERRAVLEKTFEACATQRSTRPLTEQAAAVQEQLDRLSEADPGSGEYGAVGDLNNLLRFLANLVNTGQQAEDE